MPSAAIFEREGFLVVPDALESQYVAEINRVIAADMAAWPDEWVWFSDSFIQTVDILPRRTEFDRIIENPRILPLLTRLLGNNITFEEFSIIIRNPTTEGSDHKSWRRDIIPDFDRRFEINAVSVIYYLTDVIETDDCFSIIQTGMEQDLIGPAGSAILFHARCLHSGKLKPQSRQRRTLQVYYSKLGLPRTPKNDPWLPPHLYAKWNRTDMIDGTGRKPANADPAAGAAALLRKVHSAK